MLVRLGEDDSPFALLRSLDEEVEFVVAPPAPFFPDYEPELDDATAERLELRTADDALLLVIVTVAENPAESTANLLGPIVVNRHSRSAAQAILEAGRYAAREALFPS
jgi:flagellar assembly factor FliW